MPDRQLQIDYPSNEEVVKANELVKAKTPFTKMEHRVVAALIAQLEKGQTVFEEQTVSLKRLREMSGVVSPDFYQRAVEICDSLASKSVGVQKEGPNGGREYHAIPVFEVCKYVEKKGTIRAKFNDRMGDYLLDLRNRYTMYWLPFFLRLPSRHSMRIYELMKMREGLREVRIDVGEFREILGIEDKYAGFSSVKRMIIEKSRKLVAKHTDIRFSYQIVRDGQTPVRIRFYIQNQPVEKESLPAPKREKTYDYDQKSERMSGPKTMFKAELSQEELQRLGEEGIEKIYQEAKKDADGDAGEWWQNADTLRRMNHIYAQGKGSSP